MKKRFYLKYAGIFLLNTVLVFLSTFLYTSIDANEYATSTTEEIYTYVSIIYVYFIFPIPVWFLSLGFIRRFKKGKIDKLKLVRRVKSIPVKTLIALFICGVIWTYFGGVPNAIEEGWELITKVQVILDLNYMWIIFPMYVTYLLSSAFEGSIREYFFDKYNIKFSSGRNKLWVKLIILVFVISIIPLIGNNLVTYSLINGSAVGEIDYSAFYVQILNISICIILGLVVVTKDLTNSTSKLLESFKKIKNGILSERLAVTATDEMGILTENFNAMADGLEERENIRNAFGQYVSEDVANEILTKGELLKGEERIVSILFTDIAGYTSLVESLSPVETINLMNEYYELLIGIVKEFGGTVNKFIGDALMVMFNAPMDDPNHAENAIKCGEKIVVESTRNKFANGITLNTRVGINSGPVIAGKLGGIDRFEYTILGDAVNIAQRLEQLNKSTKTDLLFSQETAIKAGGIEKYRRIGSAKVKGKKESVVVYSIKLD